MILKPIKTMYCDINPNYGVFEEAKQIAINEDCVVEVRWYPNCYAGWCQEFVFADSDTVKLANNVPKVYGW